MFRLKKTNPALYTHEKQVEHHVTRWNDIRCGFGWTHPSHCLRIMHTRALIDMLFWKFLRYLGTAKVLDVGCGFGEQCMMIPWRNADILGIDVSPRTIERANQLNEDFSGDLFGEHFFHSSPRKKFMVKSWYDIASHGTELPKYDLVIASEIIEHVHDPELFIKFLADSSKKYLLLTTPRYIPHDKTPTHLWTFTEEKLLDMLEKHWKTEMFHCFDDPTAGMQRFQYYVGVRK